MFLCGPFNMLGSWKMFAKRYYLLCVILVWVFILLVSVEWETFWIRRQKTLNEDLKLSKPNNTSILIIYWTHVFDDVVSVTNKPHDWPFFSLGENCPVQCELSNNKSRLNEASALVMHARNSEEIPSERLKTVPWILHTNENPLYTATLKDKGFLKKFNFLASYRLDSDFPCPEFTIPDITKPVEFEQKYGLVLALYSNCETVRTLYIFRLMKHIKVDSYGKCLRNKPAFPKDRGNKSRAKDLMRYYKFTLVFPNADCDYYLTEKIYNALSAGSVPVWMGTDKIDEVLQWGNLRHSIIKVNEFPTPKKLAMYLTWLAGNKKEYNMYLKWKYEGFRFSPRYYKSAIGVWWHGLPLYCRICMRLAYDKQGHNGLPVDKCDYTQRRTLEKWITE